jgi:bacteriocin-like protein
MNNEIRELNIDELNTVTGGSWVHDVATYVNAYVAALGTVPEKVGTEACNNPAMYGPISN